MRTDAILDQIDTALHDWTVSGDAMRSQPGPELAGQAAGTNPTVQITDEVGIDQVTIDPAALAPQPSLTWADMQEWLARMEAERVQRAQAMLEALRTAAEAIRPAADSASHAMEALAQAVRQLPTPPGRRTDRPAWQSPYGPPRKR